MRVVFAPQAATDVEAILQYIADRSSSPVIARHFVAGIIAHCRKLGLFPHRGTKRDDLRPGIRTIGYRRRVTIAFKVDQDVVTILRVFYAGRDIKGALRDKE